MFYKYEVAYPPFSRQNETNVKLNEVHMQGPDRRLPENEGPRWPLN